eukprot:1160071-Pelagomonas_calceolata.AAC.18
MELFLAALTVLLNCTLQIDVCIVGAGVAGLAAAVALLRVDPRLSVKVKLRLTASLGDQGSFKSMYWTAGKHQQVNMEVRSAGPMNIQISPASCAHIGSSFALQAGFLSLQPNGRKAAAAISPDLGKALERNALLEKRTLLHGEDAHVCLTSTLLRKLPLEHLLEWIATENHFPIEHQALFQAPSPLLKRRRLITRLDMPHELAPSEDIVQEERAGSSKVLEGAECMHSGYLDHRSRVLEKGGCPSKGKTARFFCLLCTSQHGHALLGCDGPFSGVRAQCVQDAEPAYDVSGPAMSSKRIMQLHGCLASRHFGLSSTTVGWMGEQ